jgi:hypothetical protein
VGFSVNFNADVDVWFQLDDLLLQVRLLKVIIQKTVQNVGRTLVIHCDFDKFRQEHFPIRVLFYEVALFVIEVLDWLVLVLQEVVVLGD